MRLISHFLPLASLLAAGAITSELKAAIPLALDGDIPCGGSVQVESGDTIGTIAAICGVSTAAILSVNDELSDANSIYAGQTLIIPAATPVAELDTAALEEILAPVALYPDALLAEILPAATYPLEIVQADRLAKNAGAEANTDNQDWAPSVKALVRYPEVLAMMSNDLDWTISLGDAFLAEPDAVFSAVQTLRARANNAGNLETNEHHEIIVEPVTDIEYAEPVVEHRTVIRIVPRYVDRIYVPYYDSYRVYHPYDSYYGHHGPTFSYSIGYGLGGWLTHYMDWNHHNLRIYPNHYRRPYYYHGHHSYVNLNVYNWSPWYHRPSHRRGYRYISQPRVRIQEGQRHLVNVSNRNGSRRDADYRSRERFSSSTSGRRQVVRQSDQRRGSDNRQTRANTRTQDRAAVLTGLNNANQRDRRNTRERRTDANQNSNIRARLRAQPDTAIAQRQYASTSARTNNRANTTVRTRQRDASDQPVRVRQPQQANSRNARRTAAGNTDRREALDRQVRRQTTNRSPQSQQANANQSQRGQDRQVRRESPPVRQSRPETPRRESSSNQPRQQSRAPERRARSDNARRESSQRSDGGRERRNSRQRN